jgi:hypothetical protein
MSRTRCKCWNGCHPAAQHAICQSGQLGGNGFNSVLPSPRSWGFFLPTGSHRRRSCYRSSGIEDEARKMAALNMVKCMWRQPHPPVEFAVIRLDGGPTESHSRLSTDAQFRSVAMPCGCRLVGAILTGVVRTTTARDMADRESATTLIGSRRDRY